MHKKMTLVSDDSVTTLLNFDLSVQDRLLILLASDSGLRLGEIAGLSVNSIAAPDATNAFYRGAIFGKRSSRQFGVSDRTAAAFQKHIEGTTAAKHAPLFSDVAGTRTSAARLSLRFQKMCKEAGIEPFSFNSFRHTLAARLAYAGCPPRILASLLGYSLRSIAASL
jgi:integrase